MSLKEGKAEVILGAFFFVLGVLLVFLIIPGQIRLVDGASPQPRFFPSLIAGLMGVLGVVLFAGGLRKMKTVKEEDQSVTFSLQFKELLLVVLTLVIMALYVVLLNFVPYMPATMIALAVLITLYGQRNIFKIVGVSVLLPIIIYVGLTYGLQMRLP